MTDEVRKYAEKRISESGIRMVSGHYPDFDSLKFVDEWLEKMQYAFEYYKNEFIWSMTSVDEDEYMAMVNRLRKNDENVPPELLRTKYRKGYERLRHELKVATTLIVRDVVLRGLLIRREDASKAYTEINQLIEDSGLMKKISHAVFQEHDIGHMESLVMELRGKVHDMADKWLDEEMDGQEGVL